MNLQYFFIIEEDISGLHHFNLCEDFNRMVEPLRLFHPTI